MLLSLPCKIRSFILLNSTGMKQAHGRQFYFTQNLLYKSISDSTLSQNSLHPKFQPHMSIRSQTANGLFICLTKQVSLGAVGGNTHPKKSEYCIILVEDRSLELLIYLINICDLNQINSRFCSQTSYTLIGKVDNKSIVTSL